MTCLEIQEGDIAEKYCLQQLSPEQAAEYEDHYFGCPKCFEEFENVGTMRAALPKVAEKASAKPRRALRASWWLGLAAGLALCVGLGIWWAVSSPGGGRPAPEIARRDEAARKEALLLLARVEPPPFRAPRVRGGDANDAAQQAFLAAMKPYSERNYAAALPMLANLKGANAAYYSGICLLMLDRPAAALERLHAASSDRESLYAESALYFEAKAQLGLGRAAEAAALLEQALALHGDREKEIAELLAAVRKLQ